jgi:hypothetical protein
MQLNRWDNHPMLSKPYFLYTLLPTAVFIAFVMIYNINQSNFNYYSNDLKILSKYNYE